jgi:cytochrome c oxidase assembly protein Cox11
MPLSNWKRERIKVQRNKLTYIYIYIYIYIIYTIYANIHIYAYICKYPQITSTVILCYMLGFSKQQHESHQHTDIFSLTIMDSLGL